MSCAPAIPFFGLQRRNEQNTHVRPPFPVVRRKFRLSQRHLTSQSPAPYVRWNSSSSSSSYRGAGT